MTFGNYWPDPEHVQKLQCFALASFLAGAAVLSQPLVLAKDGGASSADKTTVQQNAEWLKILRTAFKANISGNTDEAYSKYRAAIAAAEKAQDGKGMMICLGALADFLDSRDILNDQEWPRKRALELAEKNYGKESPEYAQQLARMGGWCARSGKTGQARQYLDRSIKILGGTNSQHPMEEASWYAASANLQVAQGKLALADESYKKALALLESRVPPAQPTVLKLCKQYALLLDKLGRKAEAEKLRQRVEKAREPATTRTAVGSQSDSFLRAVHDGKQADHLNERSKAMAFWRKAVAEAEKRPDLDNQLPFALVRLGDELRLTNKSDEAIKLYKRALELRQKSNSSNTLGMARNLERLALCLNAQHKWAEVETLLKQALEIEKNVQAGEQIIATTMESLLPACMANKDIKEAEIIANELLALAAKQSGPAAINNKRMATGVLGSIYIQTGRVDQGMKLMKELSATKGDSNAYKARKVEIEKKTDQSELK